MKVAEDRWNFKGKKEELYMVGESTGVEAAARAASFSEAIDDEELEVRRCEANTSMRLAVLWDSIKPLFIVSFWQNYGLVP